MVYFGKVNAHRRLQESHKLARHLAVAPVITPEGKLTPDESRRIADALGVSESTVHNSVRVVREATRIAASVGLL